MQNKHHVTHGLDIKQVCYHQIVLQWLIKGVLVSKRAHTKSILEDFLNNSLCIDVKESERIEAGNKMRRNNWGKKMLKSENIRSIKLLLPRTGGDWQKRKFIEWNMILVKVFQRIQCKQTQRLKSKNIKHHAYKLQCMN